jgi:hypothetical protein
VHSGLHGAARGGCEPGNRRRQQAVAMGTGCPVVGNSQVNAALTELFPLGPYSWSQRLARAHGESDEGSAARTSRAERTPWAANARVNTTARLDRRIHERRASRHSRDQPSRPPAGRRTRPRGVPRFRECRAHGTRVADRIRRPANFASRSPLRFDARPELRGRQGSATCGRLHTQLAASTRPASTRRRQKRESWPRWRDDRFDREAALASTAATGFVPQVAQR